MWLTSIPPRVEKTVYSAKYARQYPSCEMVPRLLKATYPGCDMAGRPRAARRGATAAGGPTDGAVWDAEVRCLFDLRGGEGAVG